MKLPVWRCHKEVEGFQIANILAQELGTATNTVAPPRYIGGRLVCSKTEYVLSDETGEFTAVVGDDYYEKNEPYIGGYFVRYDNGHESFSPSDVFEDGYSKGARSRVLHIQVGNDDFQPTLEDLEQLSNIFQSAINHPMGAVVATPAGYVHSEIRERGITDDLVLFTCEVTPVEDEDVQTPEPGVNWRTIVVWPANIERKTVAYPPNAIHVENTSEMRDIRKVRGNSVNRVILRGGLIEVDLTTELHEVLYFATRTHTSYTGADVEFEELP